MSLNEMKLIQMRQNQHFHTNFTSPVRELNYPRTCNQHVLYMLSFRSILIPHAPHECSFLTPKSHHAALHTAHIPWYGN